MGISNNKKAKIVIVISVILVIAVLVAVVFAITSKKYNSSSQGISTPNSDSQTDVKVLHLGDKEPENVNEIFVYKVTSEEEEKMKKEAEEWLKQDLETKVDNTTLSQAEYQDTMDKDTDVWTKMMDESKEMLIKYNGEDVVKRIENEREDSLRTEEVDPKIGVTSGTIKMWELWLNTIYEHDEEITDSERAVLLTMITPASLKAYVEKYPEYSRLYEIWEELNARYPFPDEAIAKRMSEI